MNTRQVFAEARRASIRMWVPKDEDKVLVSSLNPIREEWKEGIRANKDQIMRDLLMAQAESFLQERFIEASGAEAIPEECYTRVNEAYASGTITELREALRDYVRAGLAEYRAARERREKNRSSL